MSKTALISILSVTIGTIGTLCGLIWGDITGDIEKLSDSLDRSYIQQATFQKELAAGTFTDSLSVLDRMQLNARMEKCELEIVALKSR